MKNRYIYFLLLIIAVQILCAQENNEERYKNVILYGTDTEITKLVQMLQSEKITTMDDELAKLVDTTKSTPVRVAVLGYFAGNDAASGSGAAADIALDFLRRHAEAEPALVDAALEYTAKKGGPGSAEALIQMIETGELRYQNTAIRALGKVSVEAPAGEKKQTADFLLGFYKDKAASDETRRQIIDSLGEGRLPAADFFIGIINNPDENSILRSEALTAAGKLGDSLGGPELRDAVAGALNAQEPLVRVAAVGALGAFAGKETDAALLDALRDSFFRTRLAAVKALAARKLEAAIGFLEFRAQNDEAANVREESVRTLGAYHSAAADAALLSLYDNKRSGEKIRLLAAETLVKNNPSAYTKKLMADMDEAKKAKQKTLATGLLRALSASEGSGAQELVNSLLSGGEPSDQSVALDIIGNNKMTGFRAQLEKIADDPKNALRFKAKTVLEKIK